MKNWIITKRTQTLFTDRWLEAGTQVEIDGSPKLRNGEWWTLVYVGKRPAVVRSADLAQKLTGKNEVRN